ncbi:MAG: hypothetical protein KDN05_24390, partial [Verrucomicrobiae bacterium]|nr:hypothetical protein [Verrucomicrobiae bacterium]
MAEWIRQKAAYDYWKERRSYLERYPDRFFSRICNDWSGGGVKPVDRVWASDSYKNLLAESYAGNADGRAAENLAARLLHLSDTARSKVDGSVSGLRLREDLAGLGPQGVIPEIGFAGTLDAGEPLVVRSSDGSPLPMMVRDMKITDDGRTLWMFGTSSGSRVWKSPGNVGIRKGETGSYTLAKIDLKTMEGSSHVPGFMERVYGIGGTMFLDDDGVYCAPSDHRPVFAFSKNDEWIEWGDEVTSSRSASGWKGAAVFAGGRFYVISEKYLRNGDTEMMRRIYSLAPGEKPVVLAEGGRLPARSPFDGGKDVPDGVVVRNGKPRFFANTVYANRELGPKAATYD